MSNLVELTRELGHFPRQADLKMKRRRDRTFPPEDAFRRVGRKAELAAALLRYCEEQGDLDDVAGEAAKFARSEPRTSLPLADDDEAFGYVYLLKSGKYYKIGYSVCPEQRHRQLAIQLPEKATLVHKIQTDDPPGIEAYWHRRFAEKRKNGEWFELDQRDVKAFRRRRFM